MNSKPLIVYGEFGLFELSTPCDLEVVAGGTNVYCPPGDTNGACPNVCDVQDLVCSDLGPLPENVLCVDPGNLPCGNTACLPDWTCDINPTCGANPTCR